MFYNWKYCSFYPKNFGASALTPTEVHVYPDRGTCVPRPRYDDVKICFSRLLSTNTSNETNFSGTRATIFSVKCLR